MALEALARQSLGYFIAAYGELYKGEAIKPDELEALIWGRMIATSAGMANTGVIIPYENIKRAKVTLPYLPDQINYTGCQAIKKNGGLYTPCCAKTDGAFCKGCTHTKEGVEKELDYGIVEQRETNIATGMFKPVTYGDWLKSHKKTSLSDVYEKLRTSGISIEIPASELTESDKRRKGRPGKAEPTTDEDGPAKKRTRKPKAKAESDDESLSSKSTKSSKSKSKKGFALDMKALTDAESESEDEANSNKAASAELSAESESDEEAKPKTKKEKKVKEVKAESDEEAKPKTKKEKKVKEVKAESDEEAKPKAKKEKKVKEVKAEKEKAPKEKKVKEPKEPEDEFADFEMQDGDEIVEVDDKKVVLREENGTQHLLDKNGKIIGHIDEDGDAVWN
jgi:hypothetical protein